MPTRRYSILFAALLITACTGGERRSAAGPDTAATARPLVIDSILPIEEHLRRFREGVPEVAGLAGGLASDTALVQAFLAAVSARDSVALAQLVLSRAEFAWLYYPAHIYARPPYELDPLTSWMLQQGNGDKGFSRVLREYGGQRLAYVTHGCKPAATLAPPAREWNQCEVGLKVGDYETVKRMFGSIVEIGGQYKFVSYANDL
jgi:hypothetical protein